MTALDPIAAESSTTTTATAATSTPQQPGRGKSRLSLRANRKRPLNPDISPAPEPRTSHRFRTSSNSDSSDDRNKTPPMIRKMSLSRNALGRRTSGGSSQSGGGGPGSGGGGGGGSGSGESGGYSGGGGGGSIGGRVAGVCPLANMGNTCFLNSVLYALRFLPGFTHDLHHLHTHLQTAGDQSDPNLEQRIQFLSELHRVFVSLGQEERSGTEKRIPAFQPFDFLEALRVVNPMFEGNRQQDAHELLHCLLDKLSHLPQDLLQKVNGAGEGGGAGINGAVVGLGASSRVEKETRGGDLGPPQAKRSRRRSERIQAIEEDSSKAMDVVGSKFVGVMCLETRCFECEKVNGREETFLELCVPVKTKADFDEDENVTEAQVFMSALCEEECLRDNNKYWCDECLHHNEARRSVHFSQLPPHLVLHVKRFSAYHRHTFTAKCSEPMPAPLELPCFCRECLAEQLRQQNLADVGRGSTRGSPKNATLNNHVPAQAHLPYLLTAVVCHIGANLSSGHYLSYVRMSALQSSKCPEHLTAQTPQTPGGGPAQTVGGGSTGRGDCHWMKCCGLSLDHIRPQGTLNGFNDKSDQDSLWLECDDDKLKIVSAAEVSQIMHTSSTSPYLLFYSQL